MQWLPGNSWRNSLFDDVCEWFEYAFDPRQWRRHSRRASGGTSRPATGAAAVTAVLPAEYTAHPATSCTSALRAAEVQDVAVWLAGPARPDQSAFVRDHDELRP